ncbi:hypothetical protein K402DRAFT_452083 [Aulographum hederae CBS 113979]|uniref:Uncharacterized protein n=1 Tax=Aulographum hederae CBS 113979 TaxID=1176131 RepID=A0A6G1H8K2_9PEZI|nr:hypothetical protein K402DRAFT_452083 [Aulographum hederae CBS 113979]
MFEELNQRMDIILDDRDKDFRDSSTTMQRDWKPSMGMSLPMQSCIPRWASTLSRQLNWKKQATLQDVRKQGERSIEQLAKFERETESATDSWTALETRMKENLGPDDLRHTETSAFSKATYLDLKKRRDKNMEHLDMLQRKAERGLEIFVDIEDRIKQKQLLEEQARKSGSAK